MGLVYTLLFLITLFLAYTKHLPPQLEAIPYYDKVGHVVIYAIATFLGHALLNRRTIRISGLTMPLWPLLFGSFTVTEELLQGFSPNRTLDGLDLLMSSLGILLGYGLVERRSHPRPGE